MRRFVSFRVVRDSAILLFAITFGSQCALGSIIDLTWTGKANGSDKLFLFGSNFVVTDADYTARFRYDTTVGFSENLTNGSEQVEGGTFFDPDTPIPLISSSITIAGVTIDVDGRYYSSLFRQSGQGASQFSALAQRLIDGNPNPFGGELFQRIFRTGDFYGLPLGRPGSFDITADDNPGGEFLFVDTILGETTQITLIPTRLVVSDASVVSPVPEPATCATVLFGISGLFGLIARRQSLKNKGTFNES